MTYIAIPENDQRCAIMALESGEMRPVGHISGQNCPIPLLKLSENFAAALNGHPPLHTMECGERMYFEVLPRGIQWRFADPTQKGISRIGAIFTSLEGVEITDAASH